MSFHCCGNARAGRLDSLCNNGCFLSRDQRGIGTIGGTLTKAPRCIGGGLRIKSIMCHSCSNCTVSRKMFTRTRCGGSGLDTFLTNSVSGAKC